MDITYRGEPVVSRPLKATMADLLRLAQHDPLVKTHVDLWHNGAFASLEGMLVSLAVHLAGDHNQRLAREVVEQFTPGGVHRMSPEENRNQRLDQQARDILRAHFPGCDSFWEVNTRSEFICEHPKLYMERAVRNLNRCSIVLNAVDTGGLYALFAGKCGYEGCGRVYYCIRSGERIVVPATMPEAPWLKPPERIAAATLEEALAKYYGVEAMSLKRVPLERLKGVDKLVSPKPATCAHRFDRDHQVVLIAAGLAAPGGPPQFMTLQGDNQPVTVDFGGRLYAGKCRCGRVYFAAEDDYMVVKLEKPFLQAVMTSDGKPGQFPVMAPAVEVMPEIP